MYSVNQAAAGPEARHGRCSALARGELQVALLVLAQEALASAHERLHELKWAVLLLRQVDLQYPVHVQVQVALAPEPLVELLELVVGETSRVVALSLCVHVCGILINNWEAYL